MKTVGGHSIVRSTQPSLSEVSVTVYPREVEVDVRDVLLALGVLGVNPRAQRARRAM